MDLIYFRWDVGPDRATGMRGFGKYGWHKISNRRC